MDFVLTAEVEEQVVFLTQTGSIVISCQCICVKSKVYHNIKGHFSVTEAAGDGITDDTVNRATKNTWMQIENNGVIKGFVQQMPLRGNYANT